MALASCCIFYLFCFLSFLYFDFPYFFCLSFSPFCYFLYDYSLCFILFLDFILNVITLFVFSHLLCPFLCRPLPCEYLTLHQCWYVVDICVDYVDCDGICNAATGLSCLWDLL